MTTARLKAKCKSGGTYNFLYLDPHWIVGPFRARYCHEGVNKYFKVNPHKGAELCISTRKPAHDEYYMLKKHPAWCTWRIADLTDRSRLSRTPWRFGTLNKMDRWITRKFPKKRTLYMWVTQDI